MHSSTSAPLIPCAGGGTQATPLPRRNKLNTKTFQFQATRGTHAAQHSGKHDQVAMLAMFGHVSAMAR